MPFGGLLTVGLIGAGTSLFGGLIGSNAAQTAAQQQAAAAQQGMGVANANKQGAIGELQNQNIQTLSNFGPYQSAGYNALGQLSQALQPGGNLSQGWNNNFNAPAPFSAQTNFNAPAPLSAQTQFNAPGPMNAQTSFNAPAPFQTPAAFQAPTAAEAAATPGYQFQLQQGQQALERSAAAKGNLLTGGTAKALDQYSQGLASTNYQQAYQNAANTYQQNLGNQYGIYQGNYQNAANQFQQGFQNQANQYQANYQNAANTFQQGYQNTANQYQTNYANQANAFQQGYQNQALQYQGNYNNAFQNYQQNYNQFQQNQQNQYSRLMGLTGVGQQMTTNASQLGLQGAQDVAGVYGGNTAAMSQLLGSQGAAQASGTVGAANAWGGALNNIGNTATGLGTMNYLNQQQPQPFTGIGGPGSAMWSPSYMPSSFAAQTYMPDVSAPNIQMGGGSNPFANYPLSQATYAGPMSPGYTYPNAAYPTGPQY